ncbi:hypothetical protein [Halobacterium sp. KA-6]|uniref:hypothetical protein n=1 Tax=Halobacterium sp. KA-6 TaxID=2896368 RepID=UPI001E31484D|nr:hypothetical protein [Halobacterium sp. KA-6]MCD2202185.1 hypothetical protein [Halobacterium sp. KA-6]
MLAESGEDASMDAADDEQVWRCKACGTRQPEPDPPCERCWNTTFVAGDGAETVLGSAESQADATALRVAQAKTIATRTAAVAGVLAVPLGVAQWLLAGALASLAFTLWVGVAAVAVVLSVVAGAAAVTQRTGFVA